MRSLFIYGTTTILATLSILAEPIDPPFAFSLISVHPGTIMEVMEGDKVVDASKDCGTLPANTPEGSTCIGTMMNDETLDAVKKNYKTFSLTRPEWGKDEKGNDWSRQVGHDSPLHLHYQ